MCAALVVVSLAALRSTTTPDAPVKLMAGERVDFSSRLSSTRANRGTPRLAFPITTIPPTTTTLPPPTTSKPKPIVAKKSTPATTAKPKAPPTTAQPKPAASNTPTTGSSVPPPKPGGNANAEEGRASWYDAKYHAKNPWICAHKTLPFGTVLTVTVPSSGKSITCEVGDRGPYVEGRILDLSKYAFSQLAPPSSGLVWVKITW